MSHNDSNSYSNIGDWDTIGSNLDGALAPIALLLITMYVYL